MNEPTKQDQEFYNENVLPEDDGFEIDEAFNMIEEEMKGGDETMSETYEAEIWLSTDGKHTVHAKMTREGGTEEAQAWVASTYKNIQDNLGTKADMWGTTFGKNGKTSDVKADPQVAEEKKYACEQCGAEAIMKSGVSQKTGKPWKGVFCQSNKDHVTWI